MTDRTVRRRPQVGSHQLHKCLNYPQSWLGGIEREFNSKQNTQLFDFRVLVRMSEVQWARGVISLSIPEKTRCCSLYALSESPTRLPITPSQSSWTSSSRCSSTHIIKILALARQNMLRSSSMNPIQSRRFLSGPTTEPDSLTNFRAYFVWLVLDLNHRYGTSRCAEIIGPV